MLNAAEKYALDCYQNNKKPSGRKLAEYNVPVNRELVYNMLNPETTNSCLECGQPTQFKSVKLGYSKYCSTSCYSKVLSRRNKKDNPQQGQKRAAKTSARRETVLKKAQEEYEKNPSVKISDVARQFDIPQTYLRNHLAKKNVTQTGRKRVLDKYENCREVLSELTIEERELTCRELGEKYKCSPNFVAKFLRESGSPLTRSTVSRYERMLVEILENKGVSYRCNDRSIIAPQELDVVVPDSKIAIEVNGIYWHQYPRKDKYYHANKTKLAEKAGYQCLHFFDFEIDNKKDIVHSIITNRLGLSKKIHARKCVVQKVPLDEYRSFMDQNHIQGYAAAKFKLGLYYHSNLIACMSFGKNRFGDSLELIRYANKINTTVIGGASRLFQNFVREESPKRVISYANKRLYSGNLYRQLGFTFKHETPPGYFWVCPKTMTVKSRHQTQKHKLNTSLTEAEYMRSKGYHKIYDCGNSLFEWINHGD